MSLLSHLLTNTVYGVKLLFGALLGYLAEDVALPRPSHRNALAFDLAQDGKFASRLICRKGYWLDEFAGFQDQIVGGIGQKT